MDLDDKININWPQLPQRQCWKDFDEMQKGSQRQSTNKNMIEKKTDSSELIFSTASIPAKRQEGDWEYLDHTADVQIHSWGKNIGVAFGAAVVGMSGYMVEISQIENNLQIEREITAHDLQSLLFSFMDECLYIFHTEGFVVKEAIIIDLNTSSWSLKALLKGGMFDGSKNEKGTEVKAITYSNMQIIPGKDKVDIYVIVDI